MSKGSKKKETEAARVEEALDSDIARINKQIDEDRAKDKGGVYFLDCFNDLFGGIENE